MSSKSNRMQHYSLLDLYLLIFLTVTDQRSQLTLVTCPLKNGKLQTPSRELLSTTVTKYLKLKEC